MSDGKQSLGLELFSDGLLNLGVGLSQGIERVSERGEARGGEGRRSPRDRRKLERRASFEGCQLERGRSETEGDDLPVASSKMMI